MRELIIRFQEEGEMFREIDEDRNYYFSIAEEVVESIRERVKHEKREIHPKMFELWIDGEMIVVTSVSFDIKESLENQIINTILNYKGWEKEVRHQYVNQIKEYTKQERELFLSSEFKAFAIRFEQILGNNNVQPAPFLLRLSKIKKLFNEVYAHISNGFYSELEGIVESIKKSYETVVYSESLLENNENILYWFSDKNHFNRFLQYTSASYQSVPKNRINALLPRFKPYQRLEDYLFKDCIQKHGFEKVYHMHKNVISSFHNKFNEIMFQGFSLKTDEMLKSLVLAPVVKRMYVEAREVLEGKDEVDEKGTESEYNI